MNKFVDKRDGNVYRVIRINNLLWFTENLRYQRVKHYFPNRDSDNTPRYGCLYTWENAIKACPEGWRVPTETDFSNLLTYVDNNKSSGSTRYLSLIANSAARKDHSAQGLNEFGFGALLAGQLDTRYKSYFGFDNQSSWWSSTECYGSHAYYLDLNHVYVEIYSVFKTLAFSVRCVKEIQDE